MHKVEIKICVKQALQYLRMMRTTRSDKLEFKMHLPGSRASPYAT